MNKYESETIINYNDGDKEATIYTCNKAMMRKLDAYCKEYPDQYRLKRQDKGSKTYCVSKKLITVRKPKIVTEEHKELKSGLMKDINKRKSIA